MKSAGENSAAVHEPTALLRDDLLALFRVGALYAVGVACSLAVVEFAFFGLEFWGALLTSLGTAITALVFFVLSGRGKNVTAGWVLFIGCWSMIMLDAAFQEGAMTHSVLAVPLLILVAVWMTGSARVSYLIAGATALVLLLVELAFLSGLIVPQGVSSPLTGIITVVGALFLTAYVLIAIYRSNIARLVEQQTLAESLSQSEHEYRSIVDNSVDPYYRADLEGRVVTMSPSIEQMTGYDVDDIVGRPLTDFYANPSERELFLKQLKDNDGEVRHFESKLVRKDGKPVWVSTNAHYWKDRDGNVLGVEGTVRDVTEWRAIQAKLDRAGRIEMLDSLSGGLAHNFNNLLAIVQGNAELLQMVADDPEETRRVASIIAKAADRGVDLTRRMMAFSSHAVREGIESVCVNEIILHIKPIVETSLPRDIDFHFELETDWMADTHVGEFEDAIINLALNARDAIEGSGSVTVRTRNATLDQTYQPTNPEFVRGEFVAIDVIDTGEGIPEQNLPKLIEPFFTTKSKDSGTGLGLSMVYGFLRRMGGDIQFSSNEGSGTVVTLYLPRASSVKTPALKSVDKPASTSGRECVLVVEDEQSLRDLNEKRLRLMGYETIAVESGVRAREVLEGDERVDIVFSDIMMPGGISGFDLVDIVRELRPGTPIVLCTGYAEERLGSVHREPFKILRKPFSNADLADAIREELEAAHAA